MCRKQEEPKSYEEECRNHRIGQNEGLQQSLLRFVVERLYDRFHPNWYKQDLTAKPTGICSILIIQQILWGSVRGCQSHRSQNKTDIKEILFATLMKQRADSTTDLEQEDGQDEEGVQVTFG